LYYRPDLIFRGATLQESHGKKWVGLPASHYEKSGGADGWVSIIGFRDEPTKERFNFNKAALAAALEAANA
jgi:hypothetical protein